MKITQYSKVWNKLKKRCIIAKKRMFRYPKRRTTHI